MFNGTKKKLSRVAVDRDKPQAFVLIKYKDPTWEQGLLGN